MTVNLELTDIVAAIGKFTDTESEFASLKEVLEHLAVEKSCTTITIRNFIKRNAGHFELKHGKIRIRQNLSGNEEDKSDDVLEYQSWRSAREKILDECAKFVGTLTPSPYNENLFLMMAAARLEFSDYLDTKFQELLFILKKEFGYIPSEVVEEKVL